MRQSKPVLLSLLFLALSLPVFSQSKKVKIKTPFGKMVFVLSDETPIHRDNFRKLAKKRFYDDLLFHRVIDEFMIQGGDPDSKNAEPGQPLGAGETGYTVPAEFRKDLFHQKGALAMARQGDYVNPQKASSGSQFYIVVGKTYTPEELKNISRNTGHEFTAEEQKVYASEGGTPFLDGNYTVFGQLTEGWEVLERIAKAETDNSDRPLKDIPMKIRLIRKFLLF